MTKLSKLLVTAMLSFYVTACDWLPGSANAPLSRLEQPPAGSEAPDFNLPNIDGEQKSLGSYRGKKVILNFWALWCAPCVAELPALNSLQQKLDDNTIIVAINVDAPNKRGDVIQHLKQNGFVFETLFDPELTTVNQYGVTGFPETIFLDQNSNFSAIVDPKTRSLTTKVIGDRKWDEKEYVELFNSK